MYLNRQASLSPAHVLVPQFWKHDTPDQVFDAFNEGAVRATAMLRSQSAQTRKKYASSLGHASSASVKTTNM